MNNNMEEDKELSRSHSIYSSNNNNRNPYFSLANLPDIIDQIQNNNNKMKIINNILLDEKRKNRTTIAYLQKKIVGTIQIDPVLPSIPGNSNPSIEQEQC